MPPASAGGTPWSWHCGTPKQALACGALPRSDPPPRGMWLRRFSTAPKRGFRPAPKSAVLRTETTENGRKRPFYGRKRPKTGLDRHISKRPKTA
eukprot:2410491-Lingulodinium_polyedra.AAC.1